MKTLNSLKLYSAAQILFLSLLPSVAFTADSLVGITTDGRVNEINVADGSTIPISNEPISSFTLGGVARKNNKFYYVAAPSGSLENSIFLVDLDIPPTFF